MSDQSVEAIQTLSVDGVDTDAFLESNKKTTTEYRKAFAQAMGSGEALSPITAMAFGDGGETDSQGNPDIPSNSGDLNNVVLMKTLDSITYPVETSVCFQATIDAGEYTGSVNEVALIAKDGTTAAKMRLLTDKGIDAESGCIFKWTVAF